MIEVGSIFHNRYKILSVLGRGGTSVVYLVKDQKLNIKLAIKEIEFLNTNNTKYDISTRQLTMSEVQLLKNLKHPAIPAVYDVICDAEHICIVMEFIDGISLDALLRVHGPQRAEDVLNWAHQLAHFLSFIHEQSIIYRDMKPANIILCPNGHLKIVDFGIAHSAQDTSAHIILGTHGYAPPELYRGQYDFRTDIFSLGMTLHHLLTGIVPDAYDRYLPVSHWRPDIPTALSVIIDRCVQLDPAQRYQNCNELLSDLNRLAKNTADDTFVFDIANSYEIDSINIPVPKTKVSSQDGNAIFSLPISSVLQNPDYRPVIAVSETELTDIIHTLLSTGADRKLPKIKRNTSYQNIHGTNRIIWNKLTHLNAIGVLNRDIVGSLRALGIRPGAYLNSSSTWLLLFDVDTTLIQKCIASCGSTLEVLQIGYSSIETLQLENVTQLQTLHLSQNRHLRNITGLDRLNNLCNLDISHTAIDGTLTLYGLESLIGLNIRYTGIRSISTDQTLPNLTIFVAEKSNLANMDFLAYMPNLKLLDLMECPVDNIPAALLQGLTNLIHLNLSFTKLSSLPNLDALINLDHLDCGDTNIVFPPDFRFPPRLSFFRLSRTPNHKIPCKIRNLVCLRMLHLSGLSLEEIPDWLPEFASHFDVGQTYCGSIRFDRCVVTMIDTTIKGIDMSIFAQPFNMVVEWFENRKSGNSHSLNEIKVVFLGDGEAGKSHTIARLMNNGGDPEDYADHATPGIVIKHKDYTVDGRKFRVNYWDFGGQEIMHSMHRIFLTGRTMYVVLLNARDDTQCDRAKYWLHNIKSFAPDAPVLLVLNKIDQNPNASVDERDLRGRCEKLTKVVRLSAKDFNREDFNKAFTDVLTQEIVNTGFLDAQWPSNWNQVKDKLENMESHYIMGDAYEDICQEYQVEKNRKELLHWFNDLGVSFCWCDEEDYALEDYVILRPDWITNALYILIFNRLEGAQNGLIPHDSIYQILRNARNNPNIHCTLPDARYSSSDIIYVLGVMRKFNLSQPHGTDHEFIPMLCQQNSTVDVQSFYKDEEILEFNMEFDYLPNNLLHRLMVDRHSELDIDNVWRTGAKFQLPELGLSAVVVVDGENLRFFIKHTNPMHRPNTYLATLKANVDRIVKKMGLKPPVCKLIYKLDSKRDTFDFERLIAMQDAGQILEFSTIWRKMIPIADILNQSAPENLPEERRLLNEIIRSCQCLQQDTIYRLVKNENGRGYVNGHGMEDLRNRRIRDDLRRMEFTVADQTQQGSSGAGADIGELDMLLLNERGDAWTIIEALRVSNGTKAKWNEHLDKLLNKYNTGGLSPLYLLTYVDAEPAAFGRICKGYQNHIKEYHPGAFTYLENTFCDLSDPNRQFTKTVKCSYSCGAEPINVYHIFTRIPTQNE